MTQTPAADIVERLRKIDMASRRSDGTQIPLGEHLTEAATEIEALRAREAELKAVIADPLAVHVNMLRGHIAKPSATSIWHIYGDDLLDAMPSDKRAKVDEALQRKLDEAVDRAVKIARDTIIDARTGEIDSDLRSISHVLAGRLASIRGETD